jgi:hypothetical protein
MNTGTSTEDVYMYILNHINEADQSEELQIYNVVI